MAHNRVIVKKRLDTAFIEKLESAHVVVGLPRDSAPYPDGTPVVQVGIDHEFGSDTPRTYTSPRGNSVSVSGVPERSFMRSPAKEKRDEWTKKTVSAIKASIKGTDPVEKALAKIGIIAASDIKKTIIAIDSPANSPQVIADKGSSNPLIDTGHLLGQITHEVRT
jgi:hypothetical protein